MPRAASGRITRLRDARATPAAESA
ncbi:MAG: hypothetical protein QOJ43_14, partial [Gaiellaceae bacterium]|nr:hypothetical protein [Gaiellaceae bacterium]